MGERISVMIKIDKQLLLATDEEVLKKKHSSPGFNYTRSEFIEEALKYYLKIKKGIPFIIKRGKR